MKITIAGDFCDSHRVTESIRKHEYARMFDDIRRSLQESDYNIVNFEFPIVSNKGVPIAKCGPHLNGRPDSIEALKYAGFNVCTLANNHILDQGTGCCNETVALLEAAGIKTVGAGNNLDDAGKILYLKNDKECVAVINCTEHEFSCATETASGANPIDPIRQYYAIQDARNYADYVIVITHGGNEFFNLPSPRMKELYHFFINVGADAVINHHQHCYSGYEIFKEKPIFYGLGNFLFDNPNFRNSNWNQGYMVELDFHNSSMEYRVIPYSQCNEIPNVSLLDESQRKLFDNKLTELNYIISDDAKLNSFVQEYFKSNIRNEMDILEPYRGKLLNKLLQLGLLPHLIRGSKVYSILNHVNCESHRDMMIYALTHCNE